MKRKKLFIILGIVFVGLIGIFLILNQLGFLSITSDQCRYTELTDTDIDYIFGDSSYRIEAGSNEEIKYELDSGVIFLNGGSVSQCRSYSFSNYRSGTLDPRESKSFSLSSNKCYRVELEFFECSECRNGDDDCDGEEYFECQSGQWESQGEIIGECDVECFEGYTDCDGSNFLECDDFEWNNKGIVLGECNVDCISDGDCSNFERCFNNKCERYCDSHYEKRCYNGDVYYYDSCGDREDKNADCSFGCENGECIIDLCEGINCVDKCENSIRKYNGHCVSGECIYQTQTCSLTQECENGECVLKVPVPPQPELSEFAQFFVNIWEWIWGSNK